MLKLGAPIMRGGDSVVANERTSDTTSLPSASAADLLKLFARYADADQVADDCIADRQRVVERIQVGEHAGRLAAVAQTRERLFRAALQDRGFGLSVFRVTEKAAWRDQKNALAKWLLAQPKPGGVWTAYDQRAKHVLDACRHAELSVPDQVQVLGVDNEPFICEQTVPTLSSIVPDFESGGAVGPNRLPSDLQEKSFAIQPKNGSSHF